MKILFIGQLKASGYFQYSALKKINKDVDIIDTNNFFFRRNFFKKFFYNISPELLAPFINYSILKKIKNEYDLIYVTSVEYISKKLIFELKKKN